MLLLFTMFKKEKSGSFGYKREEKTRSYKRNIEFL